MMNYSVPSPEIRVFNATVCQAIDQTVEELMGTQVLKSLYKLLSDKYDIDRDELPYRLETMYLVLESVFGMRGARTIGKRIAQKLYKKVDLSFIDQPECALEDYITQAKQRLGSSK
jgi:hypothetical protein